MGIKDFFKNFRAKREAKKIKKVVVSEFTRNLVEAFGGVNNIIGCSNCAVRLRYDVRDTALVNEIKLKELGATEVIFVGKKHVQAKFGTISEKYNLDIKNSLETLKAEAGKLITLSNENLLNIDEKVENNDKDALVINAPCDGSRIDLEDLSSKAFSLLGVGYALKINKDLKTLNVYSPVNGKVIVAYPSKHAFGIQCKNGLEVLVHIGIDTVKLNGLGFNSNIKLNQDVKKGDLLATLDLKRIENTDIQSDVIIVVTDNEHKNAMLKTLSMIDVKANTP
ncbi:UNVERIFIED_CONTAM: glucose PTS transporter subunit IIA [Campylobacter lari]